MAKRLTDTEKWNDDWYLSLDNDYRVIWQWLLDNCNHAGICKRNIKLLNVMCNTSVSEAELVDKMDGRVIVESNDWFIPKFLKFQYADLHSNRPVIISVRKELIKKKYHLLVPQSFGDEYLIITESFSNDYSIIKRKSKDKSKDIVKPKITENGKENGYSGNFKARGEEVMAKRLLEGIEAANKIRNQDSGGEE